MEINLIHYWHSKYGNKIHPRILKNADKWLEINKDLQINRKIFNNEECIQFLSEFDKRYSLDTCQFYIEENDFRYKSDLWRMCYLYEYGGLYCDIDQELLIPVSQWLNFDKIDFCTGVSAPSNYICNGLIYSKLPQSLILMDCINLHLERYRKKQSDNSAIHTMCEVIRSYFKDNFIPHGEIDIKNYKCLFLREIPNWALENIHYAEFLNSFAFYTNNDTLKVMNSRYSSYAYDKNDFANFIEMD